MNNALRNSIARPSLRAAVNSQDLVIDSGAATSLRPVQPGHCLNLVSASSQYVDSGLTVTGGAAIDVSFTINPDSTFNGLLGCGGDVNTNKGFLLNQVAGNIAISSADGTTLFGSSFTGLTISSGAWYECRLVWDGGTSTPTLTVDGVDYVTAGTISGWAGASGENLKFGDAAGAYFDGQLGFCKHAGFLQYNNDFSSGTSAIDSSGNGNDGTLVNGPTWTTDNSLPYSWLNQVGYTDVSGLLTPRDESDPTKDTDGNALEWSGSAFPRRPEYRGSYAGEFDGTDDTIITPLIPDNDTATFTLSAWVKPSVTGSLDGIIGAFEASSDQISLQRHSSDKYRVRYGTGAGNTLLEATTTPSTSRWDMVTTTYDGATMIIYVNGVEENSASVAAFSGGNVAYRVGGYQGSSFAWQGSLRDAVITSDVFTATEVLDMFTDGAVPVLSDGLRYPIAEGVGATAHDISGNGNDGTITNASTATEGAGFWAGRIDGEANAHNINNGFSLYESGANDLRVPYVSGAAHPSPTVPGGYTLTSQNPAVANSHNDAETTWDFENIGTGDTIAPETSHLSNFDAVTFSDTNYSLGTTSPIDSVFWRDKSGVLKDRATGYGATLTGAGLVYANNYTDGERWNNLAPWDDDNIWND